MRVVIQHLTADMTGNRHDRLITQSPLSQFRHGLVPQVVKPEPVKRTFQVPNIRLALVILTDARSPLNRPQVGQDTARVRLRQAVRQFFMGLVASKWPCSHDGKTK